MAQPSDDRAEAVLVASEEICERLREAPDPLKTKALALYHAEDQRSRAVRYLEEHFLPTIEKRLLTQRFIDPPITAEEVERCLSILRASIHTAPRLTEKAPISLAGAADQFLAGLFAERRATSGIMERRGEEQDAPPTVVLDAPIDDLLASLKSTNLGDEDSAEDDD